MPMAGLLGLFLGKEVTKHNGQLGFNMLQYLTSWHMIDYHPASHPDIPRCQLFTNSQDHPGCAGGSIGFPTKILPSSHSFYAIPRCKEATIKYWGTLGQFGCKVQLKEVVWDVVGVCHPSYVIVVACIPCPTRPNWTNLGPSQDHFRRDF